jgi:5'(3')-deoxyribonucleotidase
MRRVLLDCDGVLANLRKHTVEVMGLPIDWSAPGDYKVEDWLEPDDAKAARDLLKAPEFWMTLPVMDGALEGVQKFRDRNYEVVVLTAPYASCPLWYDLRISWLKENFNIPRDSVIVGSKKSWVGNADRFLDDKLTNIESWEAENPNGRAYLFTAPHNVMVPRLQRVDWDSIDKVF